ncbi:MAG TPA: cyclase family protein [Candidatus Limnocylindrales bacterium]|nr:cyclase family protein [Candidatus Limnocylindrales bacterium]
MKVHDVSLVMRPGMPTWPGEQGPVFTPLRRITRGDSANVTVVSFGNHTGTHVDPPVHFIEGAETVDRLPVDALMGPCRVVGYDGEDHISESWLEEALIPAGTQRVLFKTRNSRLWAENAPFDKEFIALDETAAHWLVRHGVRLVGIDYLSIEPFGSGKIGHPTHIALLQAGVVIIEGLDLSGVREGPYEIACGAVKLEGGDGAPARVFLLER